MTISITNLTATDNMDSAKKPSLTDLREHTTSIVDYVNASVKDNLVQLAKDAYPSAYAFDSDGAAQYANTLYDKLTASGTYSGGDITISTTGAWTDVDAVNVILSFTPELAGDFLARFQFSVQSVSSNATNETNVRFRITDGTTSSDATPRLHLVTGVSGTTNTHAFNVSYTFDSLSAAAKSVKLQYYITTTTNTTIKVLANTNDVVSMEVEKV